MRSSIVWGNVLDDFFKLCVYHGYDDCRLVDSHLPGNQLSSFSWRQTGGIDFSEFLQSLVFFGCSGTHEKLIKTGTLRKLGKWAPKLSRPTHPAVSVVFSCFRSHVERSKRSKVCWDGSRQIQWYQVDGSPKTAGRTCFTTGNIGNDLAAKGSI